MVAPIPSGHSANVRLTLEAGGERFPLAQFGGDVLIFDRPLVLPGTAGQVVAEIDGNCQRWAVRWAPAAEPRDVVPTEIHTPVPS
jgi:hypothetical protein